MHTCLNNMLLVLIDLPEWIAASVQWCDYGHLSAAQTSALHKSDLHPAMTSSHEIVILKTNAKHEWEFHTWKPSRIIIIGSTYPQKNCQEVYT